MTVTRPLAHRRARHPRRRGRGRVPRLRRARAGPAPSPTSPAASSSSRARRSTDAVTELWERGHRHAGRRCRWCSSPPGTARATSRPRWPASRSATRARPTATAGRSARTRRCCRWSRSGVDERSLAAAPRATGRPSSSSAAAPPTPTPTPRSPRSARLLWEGRGYDGVETAFVSLAAARRAGGARPRAGAGRAARRRRAVLPVRRRAAGPGRRPVAGSGRAAHPDVDVRVAPVIGDGDGLADLVLERYARGGAPATSG